MQFEHHENKGSWNQLKFSCIILPKLRIKNFQD